MASFNERSPIRKYTLDRGIHLKVYRNGDNTFPGKLVTLNKKQHRTFESWLSALSNSMNLRRGAIWRVYTPTTGTRKEDFRDLEEGQSIVVAGQEKFKPLRYDQISTHEHKRSSPFNYDADPVYHNRQYLSSGKIKKVETHSLLIKVWPNGGDLTGPRRVLVTPRIRPYTLSTVIAHVNDLLKEDCLGTVEKLYFLTGVQVSDVEQIVQNGQYVACRKGDKFKKARYNEQAVKNITTSPRLDRKLLAPLFLHSVNDARQSSPEHSDSSIHNSLLRRKNTYSEENPTFLTKPVKHRRGVDRGRLDGVNKDHNGMPRAKGNNRNRMGGAIDSDPSTATVSSDQWDLADDHDEQIPAKGAHKSRTNNQVYRGYDIPQNMSKTALQKSDKRRKSSSHTTLDEDAAAARIQAGYRGYEARKQQSSLSKTTDQHYNINARGHNMDQLLSGNQRQSKQVIGNDRRPTVDKQAAVTRPDGYPRNSNNRHDSSQDLKEQETAAIQIQAGLRGYQTRKRIHEQTAAATKIQSCFRGYQERKALATSQNVEVHDKTRKGVATVKDNTENRQHNKRSDSQDSYGDLGRGNLAAIAVQSHHRGHAARETLIDNRSTRPRN